MEKKVFKFITVDNFEKEEAYLEQMAKQGWHFTKYENFLYYFEQGNPEHVTYQIDYHSVSDGDKEDYIQLFEDSGWISIFTYPIFDGEWCYFKRQTVDNEVTEIFTNAESKIELFRKIRRIWGTFGLVMTLAISMILYSTFRSDFTLLSFLVLFMISLIVILYTKMVISLTSKIKKLRG